jgi:MoaA/NifB/PqqE/SkfB family radical SAM enzyme
LIKDLQFRKTNRSAYLNYLRAKYEAYTGQITVRSYPYYLCLDPCDICQLRCPTCPTGIENESRKSGNAEPILYRQQRSMLSMQLFDALLEEMGEYLFLIMFYNWGEPLLNRNLPAFIRKAHARDIETEVHTNLSLPLSDEQIDDLLTSGLDYLNASIDGFSQELYQIHRVGGNIDLVKRNLERLAGARDRLGVDTRISYKFLTFAFNEHEVPNARKYCEDLGINFIHGDAFIHDPAWLPQRRRNEAPLYSQSDIETMVAQAEAAGARDYFLEHEKHPYWLPYSKLDDAKFPSFCAWHYGVSVVTAGGPVAPCCATAKDRDDMGTVAPGKVGFGEIWNSARYQKARAAFAGKQVPELNAVDSLCTRCHFPKFVQHLYSIHDGKVTTQFHHAFGSSEPLMDEAFRILDGKVNETATSGFAKFFEQHLIDHA